MHDGPLVVTARPGVRFGSPCFRVVLTAVWPCAGFRTLSALRPALPPAAQEILTKIVAQQGSWTDGEKKWSAINNQQRDETR